MNGTNEELMDLLTERALGNLTPAQGARLQALLDEAGLDDSEDIELALSAAMNAFGGADVASDADSMPDHLKRKLQTDADRFFAGEGQAEPVTRIESARPRGRSKGRSTPSYESWVAQLGWAVAAVLAIAMVIALRPETDVGTLDPASARETLLAEAETEIVEWGESEIPAYGHVTGDVVWNDEKQTGYLRLAGMPANDPAISQYQLWIVDPERDANPVDGGVFNVPPETKTVIIPIRAKLEVTDPEAFAITREQPGGVVVSDGPMLMVAPS